MHPPAGVHIPSGAFHLPVDVSNCHQDSYSVDPARAKASAGMQVVCSSPHASSCTAWAGMVPDPSGTASMMATPPHLLAAGRNFPSTSYPADARQTPSSIPSSSQACSAQSSWDGMAWRSQLDPQAPAMCSPLLNTDAPGQPLSSSSWPPDTMQPAQAPADCLVTDTRRMLQSSGEQIGSMAFQQRQSSAKLERVSEPMHVAWDAQAQQQQQLPQQQHPQSAAEAPTDPSLGNDLELHPCNQTPARAANHSQSRPDAAWAAAGLQTAGFASPTGSPCMPKIVVRLPSSGRPGGLGSGLDHPASSHAEPLRLLNPGSSDASDLVEFSPEDPMVLQAGAGMPGHGWLREAQAAGDASPSLPADWLESDVDTSAIPDSAVTVHGTGSAARPASAGHADANSHVPEGLLPAVKPDQNMPQAQHLQSSSQGAGVGLTGTHSMPQSGSTFQHQHSSSASLPAAEPSDAHWSSDAAAVSSDGTPGNEIHGHPPSTPQGLLAGEHDHMPLGSSAASMFPGSMAGHTPHLHEPRSSEGLSAAGRPVSPNGCMLLDSASVIKNDSMDEGRVWKHPPSRPEAAQRHERLGAHAPPEIQPLILHSMPRIESHQQQHSTAQGLPAAEDARANVPWDSASEPMSLRNSHATKPHQHEPSSSEGLPDGAPSTADIAADFQPALRGSDKEVKSNLDQCKPGSSECIPKAGIAHLPLEGPPVLSGLNREEVSKLHRLMPPQPEGLPAPANAPIEMLHEPASTCDCGMSTTAAQDSQEHRPPTNALPHDLEARRAIDTFPGQHEPSDREMSGPLATLLDTTEPGPGQFLPRVCSFSSSSCDDPVGDKKLDACRTNYLTSDAWQLSTGDDSAFEAALEGPILNTGSSWLVADEPGAGPPSHVMEAYARIQSAPGALEDSCNWEARESYPGGLRSPAARHGPTRGHADVQKALQQSILATIPSHSAAECRRAGMPCISEGDPLESQHACTPTTDISIQQGSSPCMRASPLQTPIQGDSIFQTALSDLSTSMPQPLADGAGIGWSSCCLRPSVAAQDASRSPSDPHGWASSISGPKNGAADVAHCRRLDNDPAASDVHPRGPLHQHSDSPALHRVRTGVKPRFEMKPAAAYTPRALVDPIRTPPRHAESTPRSILNRSSSHTATWRPHVDRPTLLPLNHLHLATKQGITRPQRSASPVTPPHSTQERRLNLGRSLGQRTNGEAQRSSVGRGSPGLSLPSGEAVSLNWSPSPSLSSLSHLDMHQHPEHELYAVHPQWRSSADSSLSLEDDEGLPPSRHSYISGQRPSPTPKPPLPRSFMAEVASFRARTARQSGELPADIDSKAMMLLPSNLTPISIRGIARRRSRNPCCAFTCAVK